MKYFVTYHVEGNVTVPVEADNEEEALELADDQVYDRMDEIAYTDWDAPEVEVAEP